MHALLRSVFRRVAGLFSARPAKLSRARLLGLYITNNNSRPSGPFFRMSNNERREGKFSQNRQRV